MNSPRRRIYIRSLAVFAILGVLGIAGTVYVLVNQRAPVPFRDTFEIKVELTAANGVIEGIGQPVNVAGVRVGQITGVRLDGGRALLTLQIERDRLPLVRENASAALEPITPLADMQLSLDPGELPAPPLRDGATIGLEATSAPVPFSEVLAGLDSDTRAFLDSLLATLDEGTRRRGPNLNRMFAALGPTVDQVGRINRSLAARRRSISRVVDNLALVMRAASRDERLDDVVSAGNATLAALARQDAPLRAAISKLPGTLEVTYSTLRNLEPFSDRLAPTLRSLRPAVRRLPGALDALGPFAQRSARALRRDVRPMLREAEPVLRTAGPALTKVSQATPPLSRVFQVLRYALNELAYNPPGDDEGFLFWFSWFAHNGNSVLSMADANGGIGRSSAILNCEGLQSVEQLQLVFDLAGLCAN